MRILALLIGFLSLPALATEVYRWVDESGQLHYSDQWQPGAEKVQLEAAPGFSTLRSAPGRERVVPAPPATAVTRYESLEIVSPAQEEVLWNIEGQLRVALQVNPGLQGGDGLRLYLDGVQQQVPPGSTEVQLTEVYRGVHTLKAEVVSDSGKVLISSQPTTFAVRQTAITNPVRPRGP